MTTSMIGLNYLDYNDENLKQTYAGTYYVYYKIGGNYNYNEKKFTEPDVAIIDKAVPDLNELPETASVYYDGIPKQMVTKEGQAYCFYDTDRHDFTITYSVSDTETENPWNLTFYAFGSEELKRTAAGSYYVYCHIEGDDNHKDWIEGPFFAGITVYVDPEDPSGGGTAPGGGGRAIPTPDIVVPIGEDDKIPESRKTSVEEAIEKISAGDMDPNVHIITETPTTIERDLVKVITDHNGSLTYTENDTTLFFSSEVIKGIGAKDDIHLSIMKTHAKDAGSVHVNNGSIYEIGLTVEGKPYSGLFKEAVLVEIEHELPANVIHDSIIVIYIADDGSIEYLNYYFDGKIVKFEVMHFSEYAIDYELGATVTVNLNGGKVTELGNGWTDYGGIYRKAFKIGTTPEEIMADLGPYERSNCIVTSVSASSNELTEDGMTITVGWLNVVNVAVISVAILFGLALIGYTWYTMRGKRS